MRCRNKHSGTTLLEILIYFSILTLVLFVAMTFAIQILNANRLSGNYYELQTNLSFITERLTKTIYEAESVDSNLSIFDVDNSTLSLVLEDAAKNPTLFYLENENVYIKEGIDAPIKLNSDLIKIDILRFHRVTYPKSPDQIVADIQASPKNAELANTDKVFNIHLSINLRKL